MKKIFILCGVVLALLAGFLWYKMKAPMLYGEFIQAPKVEPALLLENPKDYMAQTITIEGVIVDQCKAMGCHFFFQVGKKQLRIDLADVLPNSPVMDGHRARVEGRMVPYQDGYQFWATGLEYK